MAARCCDNCVYSVCDPELWHRSLWMGEPIVPRCANHPQWPGRLHDVPGVPCRSYCRKPVLPQGDGVRLIPLGDGFYAYVDAADYEMLSRYNWRLENGYPARRERGKVILMHRQIMQAPKGRVVDHIDGNKANNCRFNLRVCTQAENGCNLRLRCDSRSRLKGVSFQKQTGKFRARCKFKGVERSLGYFDSDIEAGRAYDYKAVECSGIYARVNFPDEWPPERRAQVYAQRDAAKLQGRAKKQGKKAGRKEGTTAAGRRERAAGGSKKAKRSTLAPKPRATRDARRATKTGRKPHARTPGGRGQRRTTKKKGAGKRSKAADAGTPPK